LRVEQRVGDETGAQLVKHSPSVMPNSKLMISEAERRFPVRIRLAIPPARLGTRLMQMQAWLDENDGSDGWTMVPTGLRGVVNDSVVVYLRDAALAAPFVARWCAVDRAEVADGRSGFATMRRCRGC
jgi:hypothetical protein